MRIGTRGSPLALVQARSVAEAIGADIEIVEITTTGDRDRAAPDKERWVRELDRALADGEIDVAVHSAKDVPAVLAPGVAIVAVPPRASALDALCGAQSLASLPAGARVGTSSLRRAAQIRALREDLEVLELRGNIGTRLGRLRDGGYEAIVLALAGLERMGLGDEAGASLVELVPAAGQGALAVCARADDQATAGRLAALDDAGAHACLRAERAVVRTLEADCHSPVGAHAVLGADGALTVTAFAGRADGSAWLRDELTRMPAGDPERIGREVAERMLGAGAAEVLGR